MSSHAVLVWTWDGLTKQSLPFPCHLIRGVAQTESESPALAGLSGDGRYWARTSDPQLVELVLSQLS
jgi:hypothetical protein